MTYYFYMLRCSDDSLYCGVTKDLKRRVKQHNSGSSRSAKYTRAKMPVVLVYKERYATLQRALKREAEVKRWKKQKKEALITYESP